jgi:hypothetical protein
LSGASDAERALPVIEGFGQTMSASFRYIEISCKLHIRSIKTQEFLDSGF